MGSTVTTASNDQIDAYRAALEGRPILLFDGVCVFCNRTVQFLLRSDHNALLRFVPLESPLGLQLLSRFNAKDGLDGVVLITEALTKGERMTRRSDAFNDVLGLLSFPWPILGKVLRMIPRCLREFGYGLIARYRYRVFGRYETCPVPSQEQRSRILGVSP